MDLRERLVNGEKILVQGKYTATRFYMQRREASLGVFFLHALDLKGNAFPGENVLWNSPTCNAWIRGVRVAHLDACSEMEAA